MGNDTEPLTQAAGRRAELCLQGWGGFSATACLVIGQTPKRYRIKALTRMRLSGRNRWLNPGETALVPKAAIRLSAEPRKPPNPDELA
jgi:hypothetical protein